MSALGEEFRSAREARGLTLSDVAEQIHIRSVYLNAIENEDWTSIGAPVYVRGFIRTYARFLGLEGESAIAQFNQTVPADKPAPSMASLPDRDPSGLSLWAILGIAVALVLVALVGYEWWSLSRSSGTTVGSAQSVPAVTVSPQAQAVNAPAGGGAPSAAPSAGPSAAPNLRHALAIRLTQRSWLRVTVDGKTVVEGIFPSGTERTFSGNVADVRVGNAGGVSLSVDGRPAVTLGKDGDVVEQRFTL